MKDFEFTEEQYQKFQEDGYLVIEDYYSGELCDKLRRECARIIDENNPEEHRTVFSTGNHEHMAAEYFLTSGDKIRFFWESEATDENGDLNRSKHLALNKMGHALHFLNPEFQKATFTPKLEAILRRLDFKRPVIPQSMYIFKQPHIGGKVVKHMDASFLESVPCKLTGFWIALEDATLENGCLYFAPGSHKNAEVTYRMVRNSDAESGKRLVFEGKLEELDDDKFVAVPMKKGSMVVINGKIYTYWCLLSVSTKELLKMGRKLLGPKCSVCCNLISVWGMIMLGLMGVFFQIKSPALYPDIFVRPNQIANQTVVYAAYEDAAQNCWIAAGLYVLVFFFSFWQWRVNRSLQGYTVR